MTGRPPNPNREVVRSSRIIVRLTASDRQRIDIAKNGNTTSEFVRTAVNTALDRAAKPCQFSP